ncbi:sorting nexin-9-like isoform X1 [Lethenteron reissneri]|uniref:sorting nexin-9-like isoform X1 n=1 Tax=Lethenteron reissneri TaxID=7753 RepID=UPI002AB65880|nr:sorting nexin-9-like isoform X1 [Lethenteron reissneri]
MARQAQVLFDFTAEAEGELTVNEGDILTIVAQGSGTGWIEVENAENKRGIVPENYVQVFNEESLPPPDDAPTWTEQATYDPGTWPNQQQADSDSWEDSDGEGAKAGSQRGAPQGSPRQGRANAASTLLGLNRLALPMGKLNLDNYLLGKCTVTRTDRIPLVMGESGPVWETSSDNLVCVISSPKKSTKLHGMKSFIEYQITPNDSLKPVSRRYKHFDWLLERLISKFSAMVLIPSLPDKQVAGRFEDDFVALRMERLQAWMSRICLHPILSSSSVFQHFLHAATEKEWKEGKRRAEKDDAVGGAIFSKLEMFNAVEFHADEMEKRVDNFGKFFRSADDSVKQLLAIGNVHYRRCTTELPKDYRGLGKALKDVSQSFSMSNHHAEGSLTNALSFAGKTYTEIGDLVASQSKMDLRLFLDSSCEYKSLLSGFPEILSIQKAGLDKIKECDRLIQINKMAAGEKDGVVQRVHVMSLGLQAEVNNFHESRIRDYKESVRQLLYNQIQMHQKIAEMMREAYMRFEFESQ